MGLEEERKFEVDPAFVVPDLTAALPAGGKVVDHEPVTLTATYYDTVRLRLARAGGSLRFRRGDDAPWTVKLPSGTAGVRHEISRPGPPGIPPPGLVALVTAYTRGAPLRPVALLRSLRRRYDLVDADGTVLAEVADDTVEVVERQRVRSRFREIEVERVAAQVGDLLDRVGAELVAAGARTTGTFTPKLVRALGEPATRPPDLPPPGRLGRKPRTGDVVTVAIRGAVGRIVSHDALMRLREDLPDGDTPVHQMRVGCRRLRSDLRTFRLLVDKDWAAGLSRELGWLAGALGAARDAEVLRRRLHRMAHLDPLAPIDPSATLRIDAELAVRQHEALDVVDDALCSPRYRQLLDTLTDAASSPQLTALGSASAKEVLPGLVSQPWHRLAHGTKRECGAGDLTASAPDAQWHAVRVNGKRARYAVEAVAPVIGGAAPTLARRLAAVQDLLGEHQDAAVAAETWLAIAASDPDDHHLAVAAGRLVERERAAIRKVRAKFPKVWASATDDTLLAWLSPE